MARCQVTSEKSSLFGGKPTRGLPTPPPTSPRAVTAHFPRVGWQVRLASATFTCENHSPEGGGEGVVIWETVPFDNGSSDRLQTQNQDSQYYSAPLLFRQDSSVSYWWLLASFGEFLWWREAIKGSRSQWPALSRLHCILQAAPLWRRKSATATHVEQ